MNPSATTHHSLDMRLHLAGKKFHALARQLVRQRAGLTAGEQDAGADLLAVLGQFLAHGRRAANDSEDALLDVVPRLLLGQEGAAILEDRQSRARRGIA